MRRGLKRDWIGCLVATKVALENHGGDKWPVGSRFEVQSTWRGRFSLSDGKGRWVTRIPEAWLELLNEVPPCPRCASTRLCEPTCPIAPWNLP